MTPGEALRRVRGYAAAGRVRFSRHAYERMEQRGATERDVIKACAHATTCNAAAETGRWKITGPDLDGDELTAVVTFDGLMIVVTIF